MPLYKELDDLEDIAINFDDAARLAATQLLDIDSDLALQIMKCSSSFMKIAKQKYKEEV